jgi:hypothetical protein
MKTHDRHVGVAGCTFAPVEAPCAFPKQHSDGLTRREAGGRPGFLPGRQCTRGSPPSTGSAMPCVRRCRLHCLPALPPVLKLSPDSASAFVLSTQDVSFPLDAMVPWSHAVILSSLPSPSYGWSGHRSNPWNGPLPRHDALIPGDILRENHDQRSWVRGACSLLACGQAASVGSSEGSGCLLACWALFPASLSSSVWFVLLPVRAQRVEIFCVERLASSSEIWVRSVSVTDTSRAPGKSNGQLGLPRFENASLLPTQDARPDPTNRPISLCRCTAETGPWQPSEQHACMSNIPGRSLTAKGPGLGREF